MLVSRDVRIAILKCPRKTLSFNPLSPSDAVRKQKKFKKTFSVQRCHNLKKYYTSGNLKFIYLGIFQSSNFRFSMEKILPISL